jgi:hypothetical protein
MTCVLVTSSSVGSGRHAGLTPGKIAIFCWPGQPEDPVNEVSGVKWIHAEDFMPYQKKTFVTPAFPGYISGHSTFSRAAAEIMTTFTGSKWFPNGLGSFTIPKLINEAGPTQPVTLQWASYYDGADQVGLSRIWGGIHPPADDFAGRRVGRGYKARQLVRNSLMARSSIPRSASQHTADAATWSFVSMQATLLQSSNRHECGALQRWGSASRWRWRRRSPAQTVASRKFFVCQPRLLQGDART